MPRRGPSPAVPRERPPASRPRSAGRRTPRTRRPPPARCGTPRTFRSARYRPRPGAPRSPGRGGRPRSCRHHPPATAQIARPGTTAAAPLARAVRPWPGPLEDAHDRSVTHPPRDLTPLPDLLHGAARAGPVRTRRPVYLDLLPPCNAGCPAGENIQAWLGFTQAGQHEQAWRELVADNPLPAIHGRVCYHPCESVCNRAHLDSAVSIHAVERFLGDLALERGWAFDPPPARSGRRVLVVGGGPSGLSAAYHLARLGHQVEIRDAGGEPGGMMRYGIPAYRLPRDVMAAELDRIAALGVRMTRNHRVGDLAAERQEGGFDAVFVAVGAHLSKHVDIPARDASRIIDAVPFLRDVAAGSHPLIGRRVAVYGGGNTAMDAARTARRLGADETMIVYRRSRAQMPAH